MNERQRPEIRREQSGSGPGDSLGFEFDAPLGNVTVTHGIYRADMPIRELSVAEVRRQMSGELDIHPDAVAMIGGHEVDDGTTVRAGQKLTFVRRAGEKGQLH